MKEKTEFKTFVTPEMLLARKDLVQVEGREKVKDLLLELFPNLADMKDELASYKLFYYRRSGKEIVEAWGISGTKAVREI